jgi:hypothetical protein
MMLQERIQRGEGHSQVTIKAEAGYTNPLVSIRPIGQAQLAAKSEGKG